MTKNFIVTDKNAEEHILNVSNFIKYEVKKANRKGIILGMSGGIDCSVVARLCQKSGIDVKLVMLPDGDDMVNSKSMEDSMELINKFNFIYEVININNICKQIENEVKEPLTDLCKINIRPRVRMTLLYSLAQQSSSFVIGTSNLAERLLGYFTKWGDGGSDLNPLALLTKKEVIILANHLDIPKNIINKPPSAGLYEGQTDEEDLGFTYSQIDNYILNGTSGNIKIDKKLKARIKQSSHKLAPIPIYLGQSSDQINF